MNILIGIDVEDWDHLTYLNSDHDLDEGKEFAAVDGFLWLRSELESRGLEYTSFYTGRCFRHLQSGGLLGGEPAVHCLNHVRPIEQSLEVFESDVKQMLELMTSSNITPVLGYRAPCFALDNTRIEIVKKYFSYSSSHIDSTGIKKNYSPYDLEYFEKVAPCAYRHRNFVEIPIPTIPVCGKRFPFSGGGYFRLLPLSLIKKLVCSYRDNGNDALPFYFHPYEFSEQDFQKPSGVKGFRMTVGLKKNRDKMRGFLDWAEQNFEFQTYAKYASKWN